MKAAPASEYLEKFPGEKGDAAETIVDWFLPMMGWRLYLSRLQRARVAAGLRTLADAFEDGR